MSWRWSAMDETFVSLVADQLRRAGLTHDVLDPREIALDLADRTALNESLEDLIVSSDTAPAPASFHPEWPE